jgi:hypothetical protein
MRIRGLLLLLLLAFSSCGQDAIHTNSFYYWKLNYQPEAGNQQLIDKLGVEHFYLHYLDVDWSEGMHMPLPKASVSLGRDTSIISKPITPVIFITNAVFERMPDEWCDSLAEKLATRIVTITKNLYSTSIERVITQKQLSYSDDYNRITDSIRMELAQQRVDSFKEIQIDCDWTASTKEKYFRFLKKFKQKYPGKEISVTIRLYPYKYRKNMGVPPVDKGVLMCYNLGSINKAKTENSIFSLKEAAQYLDAGKYPLPLDIALPIFGWYAWFSNNSFKGIIYESPSLINNSAFKQVDKNNYRATIDTVIQYKYLREGDILRLEYPASDELIQAAKLITEKIPNYHRMIFYHWDDSLINKYETTIQEVYSRY